MEPANVLPVEEIIADICNGDKPLLNSRLGDLSNLSPEDLELLEQTWGTIELKRRQQIVNRLVDLAEDNFELDFDSIFIICLKDQDAAIRSEAIEGLWENEDTSLIIPLIDLLNKDSSEKVQSAAAMALGKFAMLAELKKLRSPHAARVCEALLAVISDRGKPVEVRHCALGSAAPLSVPQVSEAILKAYESRDPKLRASAVYAMGKNCDPSWLPTLLEELSNPDVEIRYEAATACGELGEKEAAPRLIGLVSDDDVEVQLAAIQALGKIGGNEAKECLEQCLNDSSETIQLAAEEALHELEIDETPFSFPL
ncbi:HEAT repeat domain-containing protein [Chloroflexota bacterium]